MSPLTSHTHCQVAPADPQAQTWQRMYLHHRTTKTTDIPPDKEKTKRPTSQSIKFLETLLKSKNEPIDCSKIAIEKFLKIKKLNLYLNQPLSKKHLKIYLKNCSQIKTIRTTSCLFGEGVNNRICGQRSCAIKAGNPLAPILNY
ncbi:MAG: hypothetical protein L6262_01285 [Weeksellaceae bacterium]|nr:hypothetical protein [Weeksellaceae bacterium]